MGTKGNIQIQFLGESSHSVTGSLIWVKTPSIEFLIECGLYQSSGSTLNEYKINNAPFKFKPKNISYVFACHLHSDHTLRIPLLFKRGMDAPVIMPQGSSPITKIMMEDSAKIMLRDAEELSEQFKRNYTPIYEQEHVDKCLSRIQEFPMGKIIQLTDNLKFKFIPSGHILNAAQIEIYITEGNITKTIAYTSDLGNVHIPKTYAGQFEPIKKANILIGETTYGGENRIATKKSHNKDMEKLKSVIEDTCIENKGRVLIPCFANSRSQEMLTYLYEIFNEDPEFKIPILLDTPMGVKICEAYSNILVGDDADKWSKVIQWKNIQFISDSQESKAWQNNEIPAVIISSSGMMTHGRSRAYAQNMLGDSKNTIAFCGYSVENSLAAIIKEGKQKTVKIGGKRVFNRCKIIDLRSFSSHMQKDSLLKYYSSVDCEKILLVHGEMNRKLSFSEDLEVEISKNNRTSKVICVNKGYILTI